MGIYEWQMSGVFVITAAIASRGVQILGLSSSILISWRPANGVSV